MGLLTPEKTIFYNQDEKFDLQLNAALIREQGLGRLFLTGKIELKSETWQWRRTGNICIEYGNNGKRSGLATTEAEMWIHELCEDDGRSLFYLMFPIENLKAMARKAIREGHCCTRAGDHGNVQVALLRLSSLWRFSLPALPQ